MCLCMLQVVFQNSMKDVHQQHPEKSMKPVMFVLKFTQKVRDVVQTAAVMALLDLHALVAQVKF